MNKKVVFIGGATASGKSGLGIKLAKEIGGEIISTDSRQVYKNIPIFSGAVLPEEMDGVPHHLLSFLDESEIFSAFDFSELANKKIKEILDKGKIPILVGGSSFYFENLVYENFIPKVEQNEKLRKELEDHQTEELFNILCARDKVRANTIDKKNRPRLIRAIEICEKLGEVPQVEKKVRSDLDIFFVWLDQPIENQREKIKMNFEKRMKQGLLEEAGKIKEKMLQVLSVDVVRKRFFKLGLSYKNIFKFWDKEIVEDEFVVMGTTEEGKYAKRQNTYLRKFFDKLPKAIVKKRYDLLDKDFSLQALKDIKKFLL